MRLMDGRCIISGLRQRDIDFYGVTPTDLDGISALLRNTEGVEVAIFLYEANTQEYKVSMRSKSYIDVQKVAQYQERVSRITGVNKRFMKAYPTIHKVSRKKKGNQKETK